MRKCLLILILILTGVLCFSLMIGGLKVGDIKLVKSYNDVATVSQEKKQVVSDLKQKNSVEFVAKRNALDTAAQEYKTKKAQYDKLVSEGQIKETTANSMDLYDIDFLWTTIGIYASEKGVTLQFDVSKSSSVTAISPEYVMCDLNFTVTGEYIAITDFIYSIENDDKLNFEISDFTMEKGGENLQATFVVKKIPVNSKTISSVPTTAVSGYTDVTSGN